MIQQFTVIPKDTRIFMTAFKNVALYLPGTTDKQSHVYVRGSFDNFRTFKTPTCKDLARDTAFEDWTLSFMYETEHADRMLHKFLTLDVYCHDWDEKKSDLFLGEAICDLNTLACGPEDVTLTVYSGDTEMGYIHFNLEFREEAEMSATIKTMGVSIQHDGTESYPYQTDRLYVEVMKKGGGSSEKINTELPEESNVINTTTFNYGTARWDNNLPEHYFGVGMTKFLEEVGFEVTVFESKTFSTIEVCHGTILFSAFMPGGDLLKEIKIMISLLDPVTNEKNGELTATVEFKNLPKYVQMHSGKNINGKVFHGKKVKGHHPMPNFVDGTIEEASVV